MRKPAPRRWFSSLFARRPVTIRRPRPRARLDLEMFESRDVPSSSIPLNGSTWTPLGPSPIPNGQEPGGVPATGRVNGVALDLTNQVAAGDNNVIYIAADTGGLWRTADGGATWSPQSDQVETVFQTIASVNRTLPTDPNHFGHDTIYATTRLDPVTGFANLLISTDGMTTFSAPLPTPFSDVAKLVVRPNFDDPTGASDMLFVADLNGLFLSNDGGANWTNIGGTTPFQTLAPGVAVTDVAVDPNNPNIVYAALGDPFGDPVNGVYRSNNALSANPTWTLLIGGSAFLPGSTPGDIKIAVSPVLPSIIFASVALRADPRTGFEPLLGVFRSTNSGIDWTPVLLANPTDQVNDPDNYMNISGDDNNIILVSPFSPPSAAQQIVYVGGFGVTLDATVLASTNSGTSFTHIGIGADGVGTYPNLHDAALDNQGRLVVASGGGIYRTVGGLTAGSVPSALWQSLNGTPGPNALNTVQVNGLAIHPTSPDQAVANVTNILNQLHNAVRFQDAEGTGNAAYGWQTVDATGLDGEVGTGQVVYDPFNPRVLYRVTDGSSGNTQFIRKSTDGGLTWTGATNGFQAYPFGGGFYVPPFNFDPSRPNRILSGYHRVQASDDGGANWRQALQTSTTGSTIAIPDLPTTLVNSGGIASIAMTAIATQRQSAVNFGFAFLGGAAIFVGTDNDSTRDANLVPQNGISANGPRLWVDVIPDVFRFPPNGVTFDNRSWGDITPSDANGNDLLDLGATITQVLVDPTNDPFLGETLYVFSSTGQVFQGRNFQIAYVPGPGSTSTSTILFAATSVEWVDITGNLPRPAQSFPGFFDPAFDSFNPQPLALDTRVSTGADDDFLYVGTPRGVFRLSGLTNDFSTTPPAWQEVGLDPVTGERSLPAVPVPVVDLNTSTGILAAGTFGRGVWEIQVRGLISGHVFTDTNGNGQFDLGEAGKANVTVRLLDLDTLDSNGNPAELATTTTDANGFYQFRFVRAHADGTPANYRVDALITANGQTRTTPLGDLPNFTEQSQGTADFGFFQSGSISGFKYLDSNGNGFRDPGEQGLALFTIYIDQNNNGVLDAGELSRVTAGDGSYAFANLGPAKVNGVANPLTFNGAYVIREVQRPGFIASNPGAGQANLVVLQSGTPATNVNFGNTKGIGGGGGAAVVVTAADQGGSPLVTVRDPTTNQTLLQFNAYSPFFTGGVRLATGRFNGDSVADIVTAAGPGGGPHIRVFDGANGGLIREFYAYGPTFSGGVYVAAGDVNGDGVSDIITGAGAGGGPHVRIFDGVTGGVIREFFAYGAGFTGGVRVASGDIDGDGFADVITAAGPGGGPHVEVFSGLTGALIRSFYAYAPNFAGGVYIAAGDVNGDGQVDIVTGPGDGGGPHLRVFNGATNGFVMKETYAYPPTSGSVGQFNNFSVWSAGLRVSVTDVNGDGSGDIIVAPGRGQPPRIRILDGQTLSNISGDVTVMDPSFLGGVFVAGG